MGAYIARRLLLMIPTLFGIMLLSFTVIQFAPGGPVEQVIAQLTGQGGDATDRISGGGGDFLFLSWLVVFLVVLSEFSRLRAESWAFRVAILASLLVLRHPPDFFAMA